MEEEKETEKEKTGEKMAGEQTGGSSTMIFPPLKSENLGHVEVAPDVGTLATMALIFKLVRAVPYAATAPSTLDIKAIDAGFWDLENGGNGGQAHEEMTESINS